MTSVTRGRTGQRSAPGAAGRARQRGASPEGDSAARNGLVERYHGYVELIVGRMIRSLGFPNALREDFLAAGYLGLVEAASRFDPARGHDFRAFAFLRVRGAIIDYIRASCELSGSTYRAFKALEASQELRSDAFEEHASRVRGGRERAQSSLEHLAKSLVAFRLSSVRASMAQGGATDPDEPDRELDRKRNAARVRAVVATLPDKERTIIEQYYFHDRKFTEVAARYSGLSKSWVSRLHDRALAILRERFGESLPELSAEL